MGYTYVDGGVLFLYLKNLLGSYIIKKYNNQLHLPSLILISCEGVHITKFSLNTYRTFTAS